MAQLAAYTRMRVRETPRLLVEALPVRRLFRRPLSRLEGFLSAQMEHVIVDQVDGDTILATGLAIELSNLCAIFKSSEKDLDAIAASLSRRGGCYWFLTARHKDIIQGVSVQSIGHDGVRSLQAKYPDLSVDLDDIARALPVYQRSVCNLHADEVVLWSVG